MLHLAHWAPKSGGGPHLERIYVNSTELSGKVFLSHRGPRVVINCEDDADVQFVLSAIEAEFGVRIADADAWPRLMQLCAAAPKKRGGAARAAPSGRGAPATGNGFGVQASRELDFTTSYVVPKSEVVIEIDHREPEEFDRIWSTVPNVTVERKHLPLGDFVLNRQAIYVERKRAPEDFEASVIDEDKRLFSQVERMSFIPDAIAFVIIEGDVFGQSKRMTHPAIHGAISYLSVIKGVSVINTVDLESTAYLILKLLVHSAFGLGYQLALRGLKPAAMLDAKRFVLEGLPSVGPGLAQALLERFGSVRGVMNATREQLLQVPGCGPKTADRILALIA